MDEIARGGNFLETIKRGGRRVKTYFSVPANTILVLFGMILLILNIAPIISLLENVFIVNETETVLIPGSNAGDFTWYHLAQTFVTNPEEGLTLAEGNLTSGYRSKTH